MPDDEREGLPTGTTGEATADRSLHDTADVRDERDTLIDAHRGGLLADAGETGAETLRPEPFDEDLQRTKNTADRRIGSDTASGIRVHVFGATDVGLVREHNEDNWIIADLSRGVRALQDPLLRAHSIGLKGSIFAVCDGMGGAAAGEIASQMAVDIIYEYMQAAPAPVGRDMFANRLVKAMSRAGEKIFQEASANRHRHGMGTTATMAGLIDDTLFVAQVGDSRAYVLRNSKLRPITKDQSLVNQLLEAGQLTKEEAEAFEHSNIILQALGTTEEVQIDLTFLRLRRNDRLLLCSDGLSGLVADEVIEEVLIHEPNPQIACERLIRHAHTCGGHDNVTAVVADFSGAGLQPAQPHEEAAYQQYPLLPDQEREGVPPTRKVPVGGGSSGESILAESAASTSKPWGVFQQVLFLGLLSVVLMFAGGFAAWLGSQPNLGVLFGRRLSSTEAEGDVLKPEESTSELVEVRVRTDAEGALLFVDGERYGELPVHEDLSLLFPPGAYQFEARSNGDVIVNALVTIKPGISTEVLLNLPSGALSARTKEESDMEHSDASVIVP